MADALAVHCCPLEETRTPNDCYEWVAECEIDGRRLVARCREGVIYELVRILVAAGPALARSQIELPNRKNF
jgi:hypothetical protein